jgi:hypothetical protein
VFVWLCGPDSSFIKSASAHEILAALRQHGESHSLPAELLVSAVVIADEPFTVANGLLGSIDKPLSSRVRQLYRFRIDAQVEIVKSTTLIEV